MPAPLPAYAVTGDPARLAQLRAAFAAVGLAQPEEWRACMVPADGTFGEAVALYALVRHALAASFPGLVVYEDDALPADDAAQAVPREIDAALSRGDAALRLGWLPFADDAPRSGADALGSQAFALLSRDAMLDWCEAWTRNGKPDAVFAYMRGRVSLASRNLFAQHVPAAATTRAIHTSRGWNCDPRVFRIRCDYLQSFSRAAAAVGAPAPCPPPNDAVTAPKPATPKPDAPVRLLDL